MALCKSIYLLTYLQLKFMFIKPRLHQGNMFPGNMLLVAGNICQYFGKHVPLYIQQQTGNKLATILLTATSNMLPGLV